MGFADTSDRESRSNLDRLCADLGVLLAPLRRNFVQLDLVEDAFSRGVVVETVERVFASVEPGATKLGLVLVKRLALLELEAAAGQILVESFVRFHVLCSPFMWCDVVGFMHWQEGRALPDGLERQERHMSYKEVIREKERRRMIRSPTLVSVHERFAPVSFLRRSA